MDTIVSDRCQPKDGQVVALGEGEPEAWQRTIDRVIRSVVSVRFSQPHSFDGECSGTSEATGFVVDAENG
jgi:pro-apoptotic serine protease NMA111